MSFHNFSKTTVCIFVTSSIQDINSNTKELCKIAISFTYLVRKLLSVTCLFSLGIQTVNVTSSGQQYKPFNKCFTLNCVIQQSINVMNVNYSIVWRHNGSVLTGGDRKVMSGTTLTVERALYEDSGNYTCTVEGSSVTPVSGNMNIIVEGEFCYP